MNSVIDKIKEARKNDTQPCEYETTINGCPVKMRFTSNPDSQIISRSCEMLLSAYFDATRAAVFGGVAGE